MGLGEILGGAFFIKHFGAAASVTKNMGATNMVDLTKPTHL